MKEHLVIQLLHKQYTGELGEKDNELLQGWLHESRANSEFSQDIKEIWDLSARYRAPKLTVDKDAALERFRSAIKADQAIESVPNLTSVPSPSIAMERSISKSAFPSFMKYVLAALLSLLIISSIYLYSTNNSQAESTEKVAIRTIADQQEHLVLQDNSELWLNERSAISYLPFERGAREITLEGEGFFHISPNDEKFVITTKHASVIVHGTTFNVDVNEHQTIVNVKSGKVELKPLHSSKSIFLTENMTGVYDERTQILKKSISKTFNGDSWLTGGFSFENAQLSEVFNTLGDHFDTQIIVENPLLNNCVFTSPVYQDTDLETVLNIMQIIYQFEYEFESTKDTKRLVIKNGSC